MADQRELLGMRGQRMIDLDGDKVGKIDEIYLDRETDQPEWALVHTGLFGSSSTFVPLAQAEVEGENLKVPYDKSMISDAPKMEADGELSQEEEAELYRYYGLDYSESSQTGQSDMGRSDMGRSDMGRSEMDRSEMDRSGTERQGTTSGMTGTGTGDMDRERDMGRDRDLEQDRAGTDAMNQDMDRDMDRERPDTTGRGPVGNDVSGQETDEAMTRSEEELRIDKDRRQVGTARLRKYIETDRVQETIPVEREELRVEREPITDANIGTATGGAQLSEEEHEVTLMGEEVDVSKRVVPKERIRLDKETVRDDTEVDEEVRSERVDVDEGSGRDRDAGRDRDTRR